ncbi:hypothetical protein CJF30_00008926 [Rutstroemia sp. NJR-2017a BBW]|nr:hypothetical protein CJF30_00008926 [Rutstroemia sp. NJR-2017a BBW]
MSTQQLSSRTSLSAESVKTTRSTTQSKKIDTPSVTPSSNTTQSLIKPTSKTAVSSNNSTSLVASRSGSTLLSVSSSIQPQSTSLNISKSSGTNGVYSSSGKASPSTSKSISASESRPLSSSQSIIAKGSTCGNLAANANLSILELELLNPGLLCGAVGSSLIQIGVAICLRDIYDNHRPECRTTYSTATSKITSKTASISLPLRPSTPTTSASSSDAKKTSSTLSTSQSNSSPPAPTTNTSKISSGSSHIKKTNSTLSTSQSNSSPPAPTTDTSKISINSSGTIDTSNTPSTSRNSSIQRTETTNTSKGSISLSSSGTNTTLQTSSLSRTTSSSSSSPPRDAGRSSSSRDSSKFQVLTSSSTSVRVSTPTGPTPTTSATLSSTSITRTTVRTSTSTINSCQKASASAQVLPGIASDCCKYIIAAQGDTCNSIRKNTDISLAVFVLLNPGVDCLNLKFGLAYCVNTVTLSLNLNLIEPPPSSTFAPLIPSFAIPNTFQIAADNSGTGADGTFLMGQQEDEYFTGFGLEPSRMILPPSILRPAFKFCNTPPVIRTGVVGYDFDPPGFPVECDVGSNGKLDCTADGNIYGTLMLVNNLANNDGLLELAIGNRATTTGNFISPVDLFVIPLPESNI